ncbi:MAG TPA: gephyrin-like molybdotransferase Glp [candidate division Zixibacteria bacterium]|jgi:molybdopterin molybdotransferase
MNKKGSTFQSRIRRTSLEALRRRVLRSVSPLPAESIPISKARGRVLAIDVRAPGPQPPFDRSAMDGFALRSVDTESASSRRPVALAIVGTIGAGHSSRVGLQPHTTLRIMTGAPLPSGADAVVRVELVHERNGMASIGRSVAPGNDVRQRGSDFRKGERILQQGSMLGPAEVAMLALLDQTRVKVHRRPKVGVLSTGDELGEVGRKRAFGHIPDSNRYALLAQVESAGCIPDDAGRCRDDTRLLQKRLTALARACDFIVTTGGVSAGDFDVVKLLFREIGGVDLYRIPMKPGRPQAFGTVRGVPYFGLPGNPVSCMVVFDFLVRPALSRMAGRRQLDPMTIPAIAECDFTHKSRHWEFPRVIAEQRDGQWRLRPTRSQRSSDLKSMTDADGYAVLPPDQDAPRRGGTVQFVPFAT